MISNDINESSNTENFARKELDLLVKSGEKEGGSLVKDFVPEILALVDKFGNSGQSGGSAPYTAGSIIAVLKNLLMQKPINPITGEDDEWSSITDFGDSPEYQNKRCYSLFKETKESKPYYLDAIVWKTQNNDNYCGSAILSNGENITSRQFIKEFPFEPKTFEIEVEEKEISPDNWEFYVKDESQLEEVFKYYNKYKSK